MSQLFDKPKKTTPLDGTELVLIKLANGKIYTIDSSMFLGQILDLSSLGSGCLTYPTATATDCETGETVQLPLQIADVLGVMETAICQMNTQIQEILNNNTAYSNIITYGIYNENLGLPNEWTATDNTGGQNVFLDSTALPYSGYKHIEILETNPNIKTKFTFTYSSYLSKNNIKEIKFAVNTENASRDIRIDIAFYKDSTQATNRISVTEGLYGFSNGNSGYVIVTVPLNATLFTGANDFNKIQFEISGSNVVSTVSPITDVYFDKFDLIYSVVNVAPVVVASADQTIQLPTSTVNVVAYAYDSDGSIYSYLWEKISGGTATISTPNSASTTITGLSTAGTYVFRVTVTDNQGLTAQDVVVITVLTAGALVPPTADAGANQNINLPTTSVTLDGSGSTDDGSIVSYEWNQISGPSSTIVSPNSASTSVTGLSEGTYVFQLTVTDDDGLTATDIVQVLVEEEVPVTVAIEIQAGDCGTVPDFLTPETVYIKKLQDEIDTGVITIEAGDILYTDAGATTEFNGGGTRYVYRGISPNFVNNVTFVVSGVGVISGIFECLEDLEQTLDFDYDSGSANQNDHFVTLTFGMFLNGYLGSVPADYITILSNVDRGELGIHNVAISIPQDVTFDGMIDDMPEFWADDLDGGGPSGSFTTSFTYTIVDTDGNITCFGTFTINATDTA